MSISLITGLNSIQYVNVDSLLPNPANTLSKDIDFDGVINNVKYQKFLTSENVTTQIRTNYIVSESDTLTATLTDCDGVETSLDVSLAASFTDELDETITAFYEFNVVGQAAGIYTIKIKGSFDGDAKYKQSEPFELVDGETRYRSTVDGNLSYEVIPNHYKMVAKNNENQEYNYWAGDFEVIVWVEGTLNQAQSSSDDEVVNNLGNLTKLESIIQNLYILTTVDIPQYLILKIGGLFGLDFVTLNDVEYVTEEGGEADYFGNYTSGVLTINLTQKFVSGVNSDDEGITIPTIADMASVEIKKIENASGSHQLTISGGYALNQITLALDSGTQADIKIGTTVGGHEILRTESVTTANPVINLARNYVNLTDESASFIAYIEISGVGSSATVILQTIINKQ